MPDQDVWKWIAGVLAIALISLIAFTRHLSADADVAARVDAMHATQVKLQDLEIATRLALIERGLQDLGEDYSSWAATVQRLHFPESVGPAGFERFSEP